MSKGKFLGRGHYVQFVDYEGKSNFVHLHGRYGRVLEVVRGKKIKVLVDWSNFKDHRSVSIAWLKKVSKDEFSTENVING